MYTGGRAVVRHVITNFSRMDSLLNFVTHSAPLRAPESSAITQLKNGHALMRVNTSIRSTEHANMVIPTSAYPSVM